MTEGKKALALGSGITLLGVIRCLSAIGASVIALPTADRVTRRSRWYRAGPAALADAQATTLADLLAAVEKGTVLFPCSDMWVRVVAGLPADIRRNYPASVAPPEALDILVDKTRFRSTLEKLDLPHPMTRTLTALGDLDSVSDEMLSRSFLKPAHSQQFFARFGVKAFRIATRQEARERLATCIDLGFEMMLQEYIPGPPSNHFFVDGFVDKDGVVKAIFARQRLRMDPPDFGNSTLMVSVRQEEVRAPVNTMRALLAHLKYRGIFSAEFKRDERSGQFNLIEVNARPWWYVEFAARCGVNVCEMALKDALGETVDPIDGYSVGRRCVFPYYDFESVKAGRSAGTLGLFEWATSWLGAYQPVFRWADPLPAVGEIAVLLRQRLRRILN